MSRCFGLLVLLCAAVSSIWAQNFSKTYQISATPQVNVHSDDASIHIRSCDCKQVEARVEIVGYKPDHVHITESQHGNVVELNVKSQAHVNFNISFGAVRRWIHIEITVPRQSNLDLNTADGHIDVTNVKGTLRLNTSDGHIEATDVDGKFDGKTQDGHIRAIGRFDDLNLETSDGHIEAQIKQGSKMSSSWNVRSSDGRVTLRLPQDFSADIYAQTGDGSIHSDLPITMENYTSGNPHELRGKLNGGGNMLTLRTSDGSIFLEKL